MLGLWREGGAVSPTVGARPPHATGRSVPAYPFRVSQALVPQGIGTRDQIPVSTASSTSQASALRVPSRLGPLPRPTLRPSEKPGSLGLPYLPS